MHKKYSLIIIVSSITLFLSGLAYYLLAPLSWGAGELLLLFHMYLGVFFSIFLAYTLPIHYKNNRDKLSKKTHSFALVAILVLIVSTGISHFIPYLSYYTNWLFYYSFETYDNLATLHLISASIFLLFLVVHLIITTKKEVS